MVRENGSELEISHLPCQTTYNILTLDHKIISPKWFWLSAPLGAKFTHFQLRRSVVTWSGSRVATAGTRSCQREILTYSILLDTVARLTKISFVKLFYAETLSYYIVFGRVNAKILILDRSLTPPHQFWVEKTKFHNLPLCAI